MAQSLLELILKTSKSGQGGKQAAAELKEVKGVVGELSQGLTGMNLASFTAIGAITAIGGAIVSTVGEYSSYVEEVGKFSDAAGVSAEEASKIIQVADDMRVSAGTMEGALSKALKNGFQPTIENLATLADRMKGIQSPTQRAAELSKIFGKNWEEIWPLLKDGGDVIRTNAKNIESGLIVTGKAVDINRKWIAITDGLTDSFTAWKYEMLGGVIPTMVDFMNKETVLIQLEKDHKAQQDQSNNPTAAAALALETELTRKAGLELLQLNSSMDVGAGYASTFASSVNEIPAALSLAMPTMAEITASFKALTVEMLYTKAAEDLSAPAALELARSMGLVNEATFGTMGLMDGLAAKWDLNKNGIIDLGKETEGYIGEVLALKGAVESLTDKHISVTVDIIEKGGSAHVGDLGVVPHLGGKPGETTGYAMGGSFEIPSGYPTDSWPLGGGHYGRSGERVIIQTPEQQRSGWGASVTIQQVILANKMDLQEFRVMLSQALRR